MRKTVMAVAVAGAIGVAGVMVPRIARSGDSDDPGSSPYGWCGGEGYGWHGSGMMGGAGVMGYGYGGMMGPGYGRMWSGGSRGWGPGMMGGGLGLGPIWRLDLSDAQRAEVSKVADDLRRANWTTMGKLMDARARLGDLQSATEPDAKKIGAAYADVSKLEQELAEATVHARNQARAVLSPAQRQQLDQWRTDGWGPGDRSAATTR